MKKWIVYALMMSSFLCAGVPVLESEALMINTPVDYKFEKGLFNYGARITSFSSYYEMDTLMHYAVTDRIRTGLYILDSNYFAGHFHVHMADLSGFRVGSGVMHLPDTRTIGTTIDGDQTPNFSPYIMMTRVFKNVDIHLGLGSNQFVSSGTATSNVALDGFFGSIKVKFDRANALLEYDGQSWNIGVRMMVNPGAYVELLGRDITSQQNYDNNDRPLITFGFKVQETLFERPLHKEVRLDKEIATYQELNKEVEALKLTMTADLAQLKKSQEYLTETIGNLEYSMKHDVKFLYEKDKEDKEMLRRHYLDVNQDIGEKVIRYYYESFEYFYNKDYYKSIEVLQQAIILDPYMPQLYTRLGSIYFELDLQKEALEAWNHALKLDPNNEELQRLIRDIKKQR